MKKTTVKNAVPENHHPRPAAGKDQDDDTQSKIIREAAQLFSEKGFHGTSIDDITRSSRISKGAFYWHFESKDALLKSFLKEFENRFLNAMIDAVSNVKGPVEKKFDRLYRFIAAFALNNRELCVSFDTLSGELVGAHHAIEDEFRRIYSKYQDLLHGLIEQGKKEKILRPDIDSRLTALILMSFHHGLLLQWSMNRRLLDGEVLLSTYRKILESGLFVPKSGSKTSNRAQGQNGAKK